jgi:hypothetical protein
MTQLEIDRLEKQWRENNKTTVIQDLESFGLEASDFQEKLDGLNDEIRRFNKWIENKRYVLSKKFAKTMKEHEIGLDEWEEKWGVWELILVGNDLKRLEELTNERIMITNTIRLLSSDNKEFEESVARAKTYPIEDLLNTPIKQMGSKKWARCPFHEDKKPSLMIDSKNTCHCFSCGFNGDSIEVAQKLLNLPFKEALRRLS